MAKNQANGQTIKSHRATEKTSSTVEGGELSPISGHSSAQAPNEQLVASKISNTNYLLPFGNNNWFRVSQAAAVDAETPAKLKALRKARDLSRRYLLFRMCVTSLVSKVNEERGIKTRSRVAGVSRTILF